jgi:hypothetical protein
MTQATHGRSEPAVFRDQVVDLCRRPAATRARARIAFEDACTDPSPRSAVATLAGVRSVGAASKFATASSTVYEVSFAVPRGLSGAAPAR